MEIPAQIKEALASANSFLSAQRTPTPRLAAEVLLMYVLGSDRAYLYAHPERELTPDERDRYEQALLARARAVPTQYITGHQEFWGMDFLVSPAVLIPRPETEHVIETVLELAKRNEQSMLRMIDVGTGSGCIAVALAKELPGAVLSAVDISEDALKLAKANALRLHVSERIEFQRNDLLAGISGDHFDFVVSNPPYVGTLERETLAREVRDYEPHTALFAGESGMELIRRLVPQAWTALKPGGFLVMEIGSDLSTQVMNLLKEWRNPTLKYDLQSLPRVVSAQKPAS